MSLHDAYYTLGVEVEEYADRLVHRVKPFDDLMYFPTTLGMQASPHSEATALEPQGLCVGPPSSSTQEMPTVLMHRFCRTPSLSLHLIPPLLTAGWRHTRPLTSTNGTIILSTYHG